MNGAGDYDSVDAFTVGAIGRPGQRVFYLQARAGGRRFTIRCEKQQVAAIAAHLRTVLHDLPPADERPLPGALELVTPVEPLFVLGTVGLGYERARDRILIQMEPASIGADDDDDADDDDVDFDDDDDRIAMRVWLTRAQADVFCEHADTVVAAGRPPCMWCGQPIDPDLHVCARMN